MGRELGHGRGDVVLDPVTSLHPQATEASIYIDGTSKGQGKEEGTQMPSGFHVVAMNTGRGWSNRIEGVANLKSSADSCGGMLLCEVYVFSAGQSEANISAATEYLMKKWGIGGKKFDTVTPELSSISAAKGGTVKLAMAVNAATLSGVGTIDAPVVGGVSAIDATLFADRVEGPTVAGTLSLAPIGTVNLTLAEGVAKPKTGVYPIVSGATLAADTAEKLANWTLNVVPAVKSRGLRLKVVDGAICLDVSPSGMTIIIR